MARLLVAAAALTGCAAPRGAGEPADPAAPAIVDRPISFSAARHEMTLDYVREHYGIAPPDIGITPRVIVLHWTAIDDLEASFRAFDPEALGGRPDIAGAGQVNVLIHFLVWKDGTVYRLMPETWMARHVIGLNYTDAERDILGKLRESLDIDTAAAVRIERDVQSVLRRPGGMEPVPAT